MLGSESWGDAGWSKEPTYNCYSNNDLSLCQLLYAVRSLVRTSYAVSLITVPAHLFQVPVLMYYKLIIFLKSDHIEQRILYNTIYVDKQLKNANARYL